MVSSWFAVQMNRTFERSNGQVEVVVAEVAVLLGVEHLEHRARRVAAEVGAHLVDLVDQQHRVLRLGVAQRADDRAGHRADVRAPVAADLGLVADAADREPLELAADGAGDRLPERGLADSGRADEAEDRTGQVVLQLRDGEVLQDAVLDLLEVVVVLVEDRPGAVEVEVVLGRLRPGQRQDPVEVRADDAVLGRGGRQLLEPRDLAVDGLARLLREILRLDLLAQLGHLGLLLVALAELVLDRLQLLAQEELALALVHLGLDLRLDLRAELDDLELAVQDHEDLAQAHGDVRLLEQALLLLGLEAQRRADEVREGARVVHVRGGELELRREVGDERDQPAELVLDAAGERLELGALLDHVRDLAELRDEVRLVLDWALEADPPDSLDEDPERPVGDLDHLVHDRGRPDLVEVVPAGWVRVLVLDRDEREQPLARGHVVDELDRALLADRERRDRLREDHGLLERQDRQDRRDLDVALLELLFEAQLAHFSVPTTIATRVCCGAVATIGSSIVSIPCS